MAVHKLLDREVSVPEAIARVLEEAGINLVFGMPGGNTLLLFDALYDHRSKVRTVLVRDESLAGVMAEVYGRLTGRPGVAIGQGAFMLANAFLGILEAHLGCSPLVILADLSDSAPFSHHAPYQAGTGEYGTWDARRAFSAVTKQTFLAHEGVQAVQQTQLAIKHALAGERGPVAALYHSMSLAGRVGPSSKPVLYRTGHYLLSERSREDETLVDKASVVLADASRPVIIAGNGVRISDACGELETLAEALGAPVATTMSGKGVFRETHELSLGVFGNFGLPGANHWISNADAVLLVGTRLSSTDTIGEMPQLLDPARQKLIQIEIEPRNASWTYPIDVGLVGDAGTILDQLLETLRRRGGAAPERRERTRATLLELRRELGFYQTPESESEESPLLPQRIIREMQEQLPGDAFFTCDAGENRLFMNRFFQVREPGTFLQPASIGGMGYAIPAALAVKLVYPGRPVVAVCGDGGFSISMNGLITAIEERIPIIVVVFNNKALGWVKHGQKGRVIASDFGDFDYARIAEAIGCRAFRVETVDRLREALRLAADGTVPTVVDVVTASKPSYEELMSPLARPLWESIDRRQEGRQAS